LRKDTGPGAEGAARNAESAETLRQMRQRARKQTPGAVQRPVKHRAVILPAAAPSAHRDAPTKSVGQTCWFAHFADSERSDAGGDNSKNIASLVLE